MKLHIDPDKADEAALALLYLTLHEGCRAWKGLDWDITQRLHTKGLIDDPANKTKSVRFTVDGLQAAERACHKLLSRHR